MPQGVPGLPHRHGRAIGVQGAGQSERHVRVGGRGEPLDAVEPEGAALVRHSHRLRAAAHVRAPLTPCTVTSQTRSARDVTQ